MTESKKIEMIKTHLNINITHDANQWDRVYLKVYTETTTDGYEVFVVTTSETPSITEDVHYYDSDVADSIMEQVEEYVENAFAPGEMLIYIDEDMYDDIDMNESLMNYLENNVSDIIKNKEELSLTDDEVTYLEETY